MIKLLKLFLILYFGIGIALGIFLKVMVPATSLMGITYYVLIWPAFVSAGTFHTPAPPIPVWCFDFK